MLQWCVQAADHGPALRVNRAMLDWHYAPTSRTGEVMTDMPFPLYPPGMYQVCSPNAQLCSPRPTHSCAELCRPNTVVHMHSLRLGGCRGVIVHSPSHAMRSPAAGKAR